MKNNESGNIVLTGMPAAGKSTAGILLAKKLGYGFVDTDILIQTSSGMLPGQIIEEAGIEHFLKIEEETALDISGRNLVIATGGSMIYSEKAMTHLKGGHSVTVYLRQNLERLVQRMGNPEARGVVCPKGKTMKILYEERHPLYMKYADIIIGCGNMQPDMVAEKISGAILKFHT